MEQWLYDRLSENLVVVLLAGFSGFEILRRLIQIAWTGLQNFQLEAMFAPMVELTNRLTQVFFSVFAAQAVGRFTVGKFAKEQVSEWPTAVTPNAYLTDDMPIDIEFDRKAELKMDLSASPTSFRLCSGDCSGL